jgi:hypothetical protein
LLCNSFVRSLPRAVVLASVCFIVKKANLHSAQAQVLERGKKKLSCSCGTGPLIICAMLQDREGAEHSSSSCYYTIWDADWDIPLRRILLWCHPTTYHQLAAALAAKNCTTLAGAKTLLCAPSDPLALLLTESLLTAFRRNVLAAPAGEFRLLC